MTAFRDERATARAARRAALQQAQAVTAELLTIPGWLLVGAPERLDDAELRTEASKGLGLRARLDAIHRGVAALDAELDALDGPRTEDVFLFLEWSRWLESLTAAPDVLDQLVPDPRRAFLGRPPAMALATAQRMLAAIAANGGHVGDGDAFVAAAALEDDDVWDLVNTARTRLDPLVDGHCIGVLLPMRLETRYRHPQGAGDPWRLRVRAHPDPVALAGRPLPANRSEADMVAACWARAVGDLTTDAGASAFSTLAGAVGGPRAAYLLRSVPVVPSGAGFVASGEYPSAQDRRSDYAVALPDTLQLWGDWGAGLQPLGELHPDRAAIAQQANVGDAMADLRPDQVPELWWTSYAVAETVGLATEVELPGGPHLDVLVLTGLGDLDTRDVFAAHADHGDLGAVAPMSPTNTVAGQPAADLGRDPATWLAVARANGSGTATGLSGVLTAEPLLDGVPGVDTAVLDVVPALVTALWPVLWQRWLKDIEQLPRVYELGDWAARLLSPLGPFVALRVGEVPYGVLPAVDPGTWVAAPHDPPWERALTQVAAQVVAAWAGAATAGGTAAGASAEQLLDVIGRVPTSRALGSRQFLPLEVVAILEAVVNETSPGEALADWEAMAARALEVEPPPVDRFQAFGRAQPAVTGKAGVRALLERYLAEPAEKLAFQGGEREDVPPLLVRLLRHSLLLTLAEASRLDEGFATWTAPYDIPLANAAKLAQDAAFGSPVNDLPGPAQELLRHHPPDPRAVTIARQFVDVRVAVRTIAGLDDAVLPGQPLAPAVAAVVDTSSHRFDPWVTALGTRRLRRFIARDVARRVGAYGWVDDLDPAVDPTPPTTAGFLHAPGNAQAMAAALLRDHAVNDGDGDRRWQMDVRSDLARLAARLAEDVRTGVHFSEALGREIERRAGDPGVVLDLRRQFPARPEWAGRRVCDGLQVLDAPTAAVPAGVGPLDDLRQVVDTYGDLLVADAVHDIVSGRGASAQEAMEAAAGLGAPAELRILRTRRQGTSVRTTVLVALPTGPSDPASPVTVADPSLAALLAAEVGPAAAWTWTTGATTVTLTDLGLDVADVVLHTPSSLDALAAIALGGAPTGGTAAQRRNALDRLCSLVGAQEGLPDLAGGAAAAEPELRTRLGALRAAAADLAAGLAADPPALAPARRWGLPDEGGADLLAARIAAAGAPSGDAAADAATLANRIRALLAPASGLPLVCTAAAPAVVAAPDLDRVWLEVVAAVRPAVARLEAHQLNVPWPAAATDPDRLWAVPLASQRDVVVYGPAAGGAGAVGLALLDDWAETVPGRRHATHAAFGFDAPRARAPQAVVLAVPPDEQVPLAAAGLPPIVLATRMLARARMAQPDELGDWALAVPTSMILTSGPAGSTLTEPA